MTWTTIVARYPNGHDWEAMFIEAPKADARWWFDSLEGHNIHRLDPWGEGAEMYAVAEHDSYRDALYFAFGKTVPAEAIGKSQRVLGEIGSMKVVQSGEM